MWLYLLDLDTYNSSFWKCVQNAASAAMPLNSALGQTELLHQNELLSLSGLPPMTGQHRLLSLHLNPCNWQPSSEPSLSTVTSFSFFALSLFHLHR